MGCHTWFYKKVKPQPTEKDKIDQFKYKTKFWLNQLKKAIKNDGFECFEGKDWYPYKSKADVQLEIKTLQWMLENAGNYQLFKNNKEDTKESSLYYEVEHWVAPIDEDSKTLHSNSKFDKLTICHKGKYYSSVRRYNDCFRYHEYDTVVESKGETFKLIEDNNIKLTDSARKELEEFWALYPDGLIQFA